MSESSANDRPTCPVPVFIMLSVFVILCFILKTSPDRLIGAAFCHQIPSRSPSPDFPFCYRCAGLFCGVFFGCIYSVVFRKKAGFFSRSEIIPFAIALLLYLTDIANKYTVFGSRLYPDQAETRFLSAFPLGYTLVCLLFPIYLYLFEFGGKTPAGRMIWYFIVPVFGCAVSLLALFHTGAAGIWIAGTMTICGSLGFIIILYSILVKCVSMIRQKECHFRKASRAAVFLALLHICLLGGLHLAFIRPILFL